MPNETVCELANSQSTCNCFESPLQSNISVVKSQQTGRCAIYNGKVPLKAGHVIMRNLPMATQLFPSNRNEFCSYCLSTKSSLLRCSSCKMVWYCSKECQSIDWKKSGGHFLECSFFRFILTSNTDWDNEAIQDMCLFIRTWWYLGQHEVCQQIGSSHSETKLIQCGHAHWLLMGEDLLLDQQANNKYKQMSMFLEKFIQVTTDTALKKRHPINSSSIMSFWRKFHSNNFSIFNSVLTSFAAGVYPYAALLNHSCAPNCIVRYQIQSKERPILEIVAAKDIQIGDELCHSYIDIIQGLNRGTGKILNEQYGWPSCGCSICRYPKSNGQSTNVIFFLDEETAAQTEHPWLNPFAWENTKFQKMNSIPKVLDKSFYLSQSVKESFQKEILQKIDLLLADATKCAYCDDQPELELQYIQRAYDIYTDNNLPPLGPQMYQILSRMLAPQLLLQNFSNALSTCQHLIACLCCAIQQIANLSKNNEENDTIEYFHPLLGVQLFTLADLYEGNGRTSDATRAYQWSRRILRVTHGPTSELIQRLDSFL